MHQQLKAYLKDGEVIDNSYQLVSADSETLPVGDILVPRTTGKPTSNSSPSTAAMSGCGLTATKRSKTLPAALQPFQLSRLTSQSLSMDAASPPPAFSANAMATSAKYVRLATLSAINYL